MTQQRKRKNTFDRMIEQYGEDNFDEIRADKMQRFANSIIRDIGFGNIDYETQGKFFYDEQIIQAIKYELQTKLVYYECAQLAFNNYLFLPQPMSVQTQDLVTNMSASFKKTSDICFVLHTILNAIMYTDNNLGDISRLYEVPFNIRAVKNVLTSI